MDMKNAVDLAKKLCSHEVSIAGKIENGLIPANSELSIRIGPKEFRRYYNYPEKINITSTAIGATVETTTITVDINPLLLNHDDIIISETVNYEGIHEVARYNKLSKSFDIEMPFVGTETGTITNYTLDTIRTAHAWFILYFSTFTLQELKANVVIPLSETFDKGKVEVFKQTEIEILRNDYLRNALVIIGQLNAIV